MHQHFRMSTIELELIFGKHRNKHKRKQKITKKIFTQGP